MFNNELQYDLIIDIVFFLSCQPMHDGSKQKNHKSLSSSSKGCSAQAATCDANERTPQHMDGGCEPSVQCPPTCFLTVFCPSRPPKSFLASQIPPMSAYTSSPIHSYTTCLHQYSQPLSKNNPVPQLFPVDMCHTHNTITQSDPLQPQIDPSPAKLPRIASSVTRSVWRRRREARPPPG